MQLRVTALSGMVVLGILTIGGTARGQAECNGDPTCLANQAESAARAAAELQAYLATMPRCQYIQSYLPFSDFGGQEAFFIPRWAGWTAFQNDATTRFGMLGRWTGGWGGSYTDPRRPITRVMNALALLGYGTTSSPRCPGYFDADTAYCYAGKYVDLLGPTCSLGGATAAMTPVNGGSTKLVELSLSALYATNTVGRAGALVHEARHAEGCTHNAGSKTRDLRYDDGCREWKGLGAFGFQIYWAADYARRSASRPDWSSVSLRRAAVDAAEQAMGGLIQTPCFEIGDDGNYYQPVPGSRTAVYCTP